MDGPGKELYDKNKQEHFNRAPKKDMLDGRLYVHDSVDWFVEKVRLRRDLCEKRADRTKGNPVSVDEPKVHPFKRKITPGDPRKVFPTNIVVSYRDRKDLPVRVEDGA